MPGGTFEFVSAEANHCLDGALTVMETLWRGGESCKGSKSAPFPKVDSQTGDPLQCALGSRGPHFCL